MNVTGDRKNDCLIVRLEGEFDMKTAPLFKKKIGNMIDNADFKRIILNMKGVNFIDSTGIGAVLGRYRKLKHRGVDLVLVGLKPGVKRVFALSGVLDLVDVFTSEEMACRGGN